ncbi:MAG: hypothetical protein FWC34_00320 [Bacteroidetes bacterium]|nr:hypothetical protein [Bacteroidota bacterium]
MKTIKQTAEKIGVSKQSIRNQINKLGLQNSLHKKGNQFLINDEQEALILKGFEKNSKGEIEKTLQSEVITGLRNALRILEQDIDFLKKQIEKKDEQIISSNEALKAEQLLHANSKNIPLISDNVLSSKDITKPIGIRERIRVLFSGKLK